MCTQQTSHQSTVKGELYVKNMFSIKLSSCVYCSYEFNISGLFGLFKTDWTRGPPFSVWSLLSVLVSRSDSLKKILDNNYADIISVQRSNYYFFKSTVHYLQISVLYF